MESIHSKPTGRVSPRINIFPETDPWCSGSLSCDKRQAVEQVLSETLLPSYFTFLLYTHRTSRHWCNIVGDVMSGDTIPYTSCSALSLSEIVVICQISCWVGEQSLEVGRLPNKSSSISHDIITLENREIPDLQDLIFCWSANARQINKSNEKTDRATHGLPNLTGGHKFHNIFMS